MKKLRVVISGVHPDVPVAMYGKHAKRMRVMGHDVTLVSVADVYEKNKYSVALTEKLIRKITELNHPGRSGYGERKTGSTPSAGAHANEQW